MTRMALLNFVKIKKNVEPAAQLESIVVMTDEVRASILLHLM